MVWKELAAANHASVVLRGVVGGVVRHLRLLCRPLVERSVALVPGNMDIRLCRVLDTRVRTLSRMGRADVREPMVVSRQLAATYGAGVVFRGMVCDFV